jgi:hypothetical protein
MAQKHGSETDAAIDAEIENMRTQLPATNPPSDPSLEILRAIQRLEERMTRIENRNQETYHPEVEHYDANQTYGRTENDICNPKLTLALRTLERSANNYP